MRKNILWRGIALLAVSAMLAGCSDTGAVENTGSIGDGTLTQSEADVTPGSSEASQASAESQSSEGEEQMDEVDVEIVDLEEPHIDPMNLKNSWQRAAFFADWVYAEQQKNTLISPLSLNMALGLVAEGASGETAKQLYEYLGREDYTSYVDRYMEFAEGLAVEKGENRYNEEYSFRYEIANSLWVNQENQLLSDYQKKVQKAFRAEVQPADFDVDVSGTVQKINNWCSKKTHKLIPRIVEETDISSSLKAILINSLYFESPWVDQWHVSEGEFTAASGDKTTQDMLFGSADFYYENDKATAFSKAYSNGFRFIGILPKETGEFNILDLDLESLMASEYDEYRVTARMPKLNFDTTESAVERIIKAQGIELPFSLNSEIDGIIENNNLYISKIVQKCKIELDENGTKAAAVTAIMVRATGMAPQQEVKEVILDRPFAFMIYDTRNNEILFLGKVTEPCKETD